MSAAGAARSILQWAFRAPKTCALSVNGALAVAVAVVSSGCSQRSQSALDPAGPQAERIHDLFQFFLITSAVVFGLVLIFTLIALLRHSGPSARAQREAAARDEALEIHSPTRRRPAEERRLSRAVTLASVLTVITLVILLVASVTTGRELSSLSTEGAARFEIVGHQWWWEISYCDHEPQKSFTTANELHIPVGRPVVLELASRDVIHSLWIPRLHGKRDLIPGHKATLELRADAPGVYRGQCAEFCGHQHANMAIEVIAEPPEQFEAWLNAERSPAALPSNALERRGHDIFMKGPCALCHAIRGTIAAATVGPDLTHIAGRMTLAAGTLPNTPGHRAGWIADPQSVKPGTPMPSNIFPSEDLNALLAYLGTLK